MTYPLRDQIARATVHRNKAMLRLRRLFVGRLPLGARSVTIRPPGQEPVQLSGLAAGDPFIFGQLARGEPFEPHVLITLGQLIVPGATVLDVGANLGWFSLYMSRQTGPCGNVIAIEPGPDNLLLLRHNLRANGARNVRVVAAAAGAARGPAWLRISNENAGDHRITRRPDGARTVRIKAVTLDELAVPPGPVVVKMDVQGAEPFVLDGAAALLARNDVRLVTEFWPFGLVDCGTSPAALIDALVRHFQRFWVLFQDQLPYEVTPAKLLKMADAGLAPATQMFTDVVCLRAADTEGISRMEAAGDWYKHTGEF